MHQRIRAARENEGGFTLIELLIVIVILGILAGVVIFASAGFRNKGAAEACKTTLSSVKTAAEAFHVDSATAAYPAAWTPDLTPAYFEANGITNTGGLIAGKGWNFNIAFVALGAGPPTYAAGTLPTVVAGSVCTTS